MQLDHWTGCDEEKILVIVSWMDIYWKHKVQVIHFEVVLRADGKTTADELLYILHKNDLDRDKFVGFQSDSCSAMIKGVRKFRAAADDEADNDSDSEDAFLTSNDDDDYEVESPFRVLFKNLLKPF